MKERLELASIKQGIIEGIYSYVAGSEFYPIKRERNSVQIPLADLKNPVTPKGITLNETAMALQGSGSHRRSDTLDIVAWEFLLKIEFTQEVDATAMVFNMCNSPLTVSSQEENYPVTFLVNPTSVEFSHPPAVGAPTGTDILVTFVATSKR